MFLYRFNGKDGVGGIKSKVKSKKSEGLLFVIARNKALS